MNIYEYETVDRPGPRSYKGSPLVEALIETAATGRALHFPKAKAGSFSSYTARCRARGYRTRFQSDGDTGCYAWCEPLPSEAGQP